MRLLAQPGAEWQLVESWIRSRAREDRPIQILEAGCGRNWVFRMQNIAYELTGIDLDAAALEARKTIQRDLHHAIVGDLRTADLPPERYDVIYSSFVLEHVRGAEQVLENFIRWLKPGGILVVRVPDRDSIQGFTTRLTPFWFHVVFYRYAQGLREAGKPGFPPYPTIYEDVISSRGMRAFAERHGLDLMEEVRHGEYRRGGRALRWFIGTYAQTVALASFGRVHAKAANLTFILEKPAATAAAIAGVRAANEPLMSPTSRPVLQARTDSA
jgi:SAM-dependent methyltransferase